MTHPLGHHQARGPELPTEADQQTGGDVRNDTGIPVSVVDERLHAEDDTVRAHAMATRDMFDDPDAGFAHALDTAKRVVALGSETTV